MESSAEMTQEKKVSVFKGVDLHTKVNNTEHHTSEISVSKLIVRRGQPFILTLKVKELYNLDLHPLSLCAATGEHPSEDQGTKSYFSVPDGIKRSPSAKAVWTIELHKSSSSLLGILNLIVTPPADAPIGEYVLCVSHRDEDASLGKIVVLFNAWCPDDLVFLPDEEERQEYVMNEQGIIYKGSGNYIISSDWDFGQFEDDMLDVGMKILDLNTKHIADPAGDVSARCDPIYVGRVVSAMINSEDDRGVLEGRWGGSYAGGVLPSHWSGSHAILRQWLKTDCHPVKYGQCWVFAGVMCSVMRLLGIPSRVITNFQSAHDCDRNLIIDVYHADYGVREKETMDSIWNFHVWMEGWMKRPDLENGDKFDGWQVLDPTPQQLSDGICCCGPAPVKAILSGDVDLKYDIPFVFAEVNADCIDWLVKRDGSLVKIWSDSRRVGQNISTKSVGSEERMNITKNYKHAEGSDEERAVFKYAISRDYAKHDEYEVTEEEEGNEVPEEEEENEVPEEAGGNRGTDEAGENEVMEVAEGNDRTDRGNRGTDEAGENDRTDRGNRGTEVAEGNDRMDRGNRGTDEAGENKVTEEAEGNDRMDRGNRGTEVAGENEVMESVDETVPTPNNIPPPPQLSIGFEEVSQPVNGKDVSLTLVLQSDSTVAMQLSINISVQAMRYNGSPAANIQSEVTEKTLQPGKDLSIPILVPFLTYYKPMLESDSMKVSAVVTDKKSDKTYLAEDDVVLHDPPISIEITSQTRLNSEGSGEVIFMNPVDMTLKQCTLTLSGSGIWKDELEFEIADIEPSNRITVKFTFVPYKTGKKTIVADFDCSVFRDIKAKCTVNVKH